MNRRSGRRASSSIGLSSSTGPTAAATTEPNSPPPMTTGGNGVFVDHGASKMRLITASSHTVSNTSSSPTKTLLKLSDFLQTHDSDSIAGRRISIHLHEKDSISPEALRRASEEAVGNRRRSQSQQRGGSSVHGAAIASSTSAAAVAQRRASSSVSFTPTSTQQHRGGGGGPRISLSLGAEHAESRRQQQRAESSSAQQGGANGSKGNGGNSPQERGLLWGASTTPPLPNNSNSADDNNNSGPVDDVFFRSLQVAREEEERAEGSGGRARGSAALDVNAKLTALFSSLSPAMLEQISMQRAAEARADAKQKAQAFVLRLQNAYDAQLLRAIEYRFKGLGEGDGLTNDVGGGRSRSPSSGGGAVGGQHQNSYNNSNSTNNPPQRAVRRQTNMAAALLAAERGPTRRERSLQKARAELQRAQAAEAKERSQRILRGEADVSDAMAGLALPPSALTAKATETTASQQQLQGASSSEDLFAGLGPSKAERLFSQLLSATAEPTQQPSAAFPPASGTVSPAISSSTAGGGRVVSSSTSPSPYRRADTGNAPPPPPLSVAAFSTVGSRSASVGVSPANSIGHANGSGSGVSPAANYFGASTSAATTDSPPLVSFVKSSGEAARRRRQSTAGRSGGQSNTNNNAAVSGLLDMSTLSGGNASTSSLSYGASVSAAGDGRPAFALDARRRRRSHSGGGGSSNDGSATDRSIGGGGGGGRRARRRRGLIEEQKAALASLPPHLQTLLTNFNMKKAIAEELDSLLLGATASDGGGGGGVSSATAAIDKRIAELKGRIGARAAAAAERAEDERLEAEAIRCGVDLRLLRDVKTAFEMTVEEHRHASQAVEARALAERYAKENGLPMPSGAASGGGSGVQQHQRAYKTRFEVAEERERERREASTASARGDDGEGDADGQLTRQLASAASTVAFTSLVPTSEGQQQQHQQPPPRRSSSKVQLLGIAGDAVATTTKKGGLPSPKKIAPQTFTGADDIMRYFTAQDERKRQRRGGRDGGGFGDGGSSDDDDPSSLTASGPLMRLYDDEGHVAFVPRPGYKKGGKRSGSDSSSDGGEDEDGRGGDNNNTSTNGPEASGGRPSQQQRQRSLRRTLSNSAALSVVSDDVAGRSARSDGGLLAAFGASASSASGLTSPRGAQRQAKMHINRLSASGAGAPPPSGSVSSQAAKDAAANERQLALTREKAQAGVSEDEFLALFGASLCRGMAPEEIRHWFRSIDRDCSGSVQWAEVSHYLITTEGDAERIASKHAASYFLEDTLENISGNAVGAGGSSSPGGGRRPPRPNGGGQRALAAAASAADPFPKTKGSSILSSSTRRIASDYDSSAAGDHYNGAAASSDRRHRSAMCGLVDAKGMGRLFSRSSNDEIVMSWDPQLRRSGMCVHRAPDGLRITDITYLPHNNKLMILQSDRSVFMYDSVRFRGLPMLQLDRIFATDGRNTRINSNNVSHYSPLEVTSSSGAAGIGGGDFGGPSASLLAPKRGRRGGGGTAGGGGRSGSGSGIGIGGAGLSGSDVNSACAAVFEKSLDGFMCSDHLGGGPSSLVEPVVFGTESGGLHLVNLSNSGLHTGYAPLKPFAFYTPHRQPVTRVLVAPELEGVISSSLDESMAVTDLTTGAVLQRMTIADNPRPVFDFAYTRNHNTLASWGGRRLYLWNAMTGTRLTTLDDHDAPIEAVAINPEMMHLYAVQSDKTVKVWDLRTWRALGAAGDRHHRHPSDSLNAALWSSEHQTLFSGCAELFGWRPSEVQERLDAGLPPAQGAFVGNIVPIRDFKVLPDAGHTVTIDGQSVIVWGTASQRVLSTWRWADADDAATTISWTPDGVRMLVGTEHGSLSWYNYTNGVRFFDFMLGEPSAEDLIPKTLQSRFQLSGADGSVVATTRPHRSIFEDRRITDEQRRREELGKAQRQLGAAGGRRRINISDDLRVGGARGGGGSSGRDAAAALGASSINAVVCSLILETADPQVLTIIAGVQNCLYAWCDARGEEDSDQSHLPTAKYEHNANENVLAVCLCDPTRQLIAASWAPHTVLIMSAALAPLVAFDTRLPAEKLYYSGGPCLFAATFPDGSLKFFLTHETMYETRMLCSFQASASDEEPVTAVVFHPQTRRILVGDATGTVSVFKAEKLLEKGHAQRSLIPALFCLNSSASLADVDALFDAVGSVELELAIDAHDGAIAAMYLGHPQPCETEAEVEEKGSAPPSLAQGVAAAEVSAPFSRLYTAGGDRFLRVWDVATKVQVGEYGTRYAAANHVPIAFRRRKLGVRRRETAESIEAKCRRRARGNNGGGGGGRSGGSPSTSSLLSPAAMAAQWHTREVPHGEDPVAFLQRCRAAEDKLMPLFGGGGGGGVGGGAAASYESTQLDDSTAQVVVLYDPDVTADHEFHEHGLSLYGDERVLEKRATRAIALVASEGGGGGGQSSNNAGGGLLKSGNGKGPSAASSGPHSPTSRSAGTTAASSLAATARGGWRGGHHHAGGESSPTAVTSAAASRHHSPRHQASSSRHQQNQNSNASPSSPVGANGPAGPAGTAASPSAAGVDAQYSLSRTFTKHSVPASVLETLRMQQQLADDNTTANTTNMNGNGITLSGESSHGSHAPTPVPDVAMGNASFIHNGMANNRSFASASFAAGGGGGGLSFAVSGGGGGGMGDGTNASFAGRSLRSAGGYSEGGGVAVASSDTFVGFASLGASVRNQQQHHQQLVSNSSAATDKTAASVTANANGAANAGPSFSSASTVAKLDNMGESLRRAVSIVRLNRKASLASAASAALYQARRLARAGAAGAGGASDAAGSGDGADDGVMVIGNIGSASIHSSPTGGGPFPRPISSSFAAAVDHNEASLMQSIGASGASGSSRGGDSGSSHAQAVEGVNHLPPVAFAGGASTDPLSRSGKANAASSPLLPPRRGQTPSSPRRVGGTGTGAPHSPILRSPRPHQTQQTSAAGGGGGVGAASSPIMGPSTMKNVSFAGLPPLPITPPPQQLHQPQAYQNALASLSIDEKAAAAPVGPIAGVGEALLSPRNMSNADSGEHHTNSHSNNHGRQPTTAHFPSRGEPHTQRLYTGDDLGGGSADVAPPSLSITETAEDGQTGPSPATTTANTAHHLGTVFDLGIGSEWAASSVFEPEAESSSSSSAASSTRTVEGNSAAASEGNQMGEATAADGGDEKEGASALFAALRAAKRKEGDEVEPPEVAAHPPNPTPAALPTHRLSTPPMDAARGTSSHHRPGSSSAFARSGSGGPSSRLGSPAEGSRRVGAGAGAGGLAGVSGAATGSASLPDASIVRIPTPLADVSLMPKGRISSATAATAASVGRPPRPNTPASPSAASAAAVSLLRSPKRSGGGAALSPRGGTNTVATSGAEEVVPPLPPASSHEHTAAARIVSTATSFGGDASSSFRAPLPFTARPVGTFSSSSSSHARGGHTMGHVSGTDTVEHASNVVGGPLDISATTADSSVDDDDDENVNAPPLLGRQRSLLKSLKHGIAAAAAAASAATAASSPAVAFAPTNAASAAIGDGDADPAVFSPLRRRRSARVVTLSVGGDGDMPEEDGGDGVVNGNIESIAKVGDKVAAAEEGEEGFSILQQQRADLRRHRQRMEEQRRGGGGGVSNGGPLPQPSPAPQQGTQGIMAAPMDNASFSGLLATPPPQHSKSLAAALVGAGGGTATLSQSSFAHSDEGNAAWGGGVGPATTLLSAGHFSASILKPLAAGGVANAAERNARMTAESRQQRTKSTAGKATAVIAKARAITVVPQPMLSALPSAEDLLRIHGGFGPSAAATVAQPTANANITDLSPSVSPQSEGQPQPQTDINAAESAALAPTAPPSIRRTPSNRLLLSRATASARKLRRRQRKHHEKREEARRRQAAAQGRIFVPTPFVFSPDEALATGSTKPKKAKNASESERYGKTTTEKKGTVLLLQKGSDRKQRQRVASFVGLDGHDGDTSPPAAAAEEGNRSGKGGRPAGIANANAHITIGGDEGDSASDAETIGSDSGAASDFSDSINSSAASAASSSSLNSGSALLSSDPTAATATASASATAAGAASVPPASSTALRLLTNARHRIEKRRPSGASANKKKKKRSIRDPVAASADGWETSSGSGSDGSEEDDKDAGDGLNAKNTKKKKSSSGVIFFGNASGARSGALSEARRAKDKARHHIGMNFFTTARPQKEESLKAAMRRAAAEQERHRHMAGFVTRLTDLGAPGHHFAGLLSNGGGGRGGGGEDVNDDSGEDDTTASPSAVVASASLPPKTSVRDIYPLTAAATLYERSLADPLLGWRGEDSSSDATNGAVGTTRLPPLAATYGGAHTSASSRHPAGIDLNGGRGVVAALSLDRGGWGGTAAGVGTVYQSHRALEADAALFGEEAEGGGGGSRQKHHNTQNDNDDDADDNTAAARKAAAMASPAAAMYSELRTAKARRAAEGRALGARLALLKPSAAIFTRSTDMSAAPRSQLVAKQQRTNAVAAEEAAAAEQRRERERAADAAILLPPIHGPRKGFGGGGAAAASGPNADHPHTNTNAASSASAALNASNNSAATTAATVSSDPSTPPTLFLSDDAKAQMERRDHKRHSSFMASRPLATVLRQGTVGYATSALLSSGGASSPFPTAPPPSSSSSSSAQPAAASKTNLMIPLHVSGVGNGSIVSTATAGTSTNSSFVSPCATATASTASPAAPTPQRSVVGGGGNGKSGGVANLSAVMRSLLNKGAANKQRRLTNGGGDDSSSPASAALAGKANAEENRSSPRSPSSSVSPRDRSPLSSRRGGAAAAAAEGQQRHHQQQQQQQQQQRSRGDSKVSRGGGARRVGGGGDHLPNTNASTPNASMPPPAPTSSGPFAATSPSLPIAVDSPALFSDAVRDQKRIARARLRGERKAAEAALGEIFSSSSPVGSPRRIGGGGAGGGEGSEGSYAASHKDGASTARGFTNTAVADAVVSVVDPPDSGAVTRAPSNTALAATAIVDGSSHVQRTSSNRKGPTVGEKKRGGIVKGSGGAGGDGDGEQPHTPPPASGAATSGAASPPRSRRPSANGGGGGDASAAAATKGSAHSLLLSPLPLLGADPSAQQRQQRREAEERAAAEQKAAEAAEAAAEALRLEAEAEEAKVKAMAGMGWDERSRVRAEALKAALERDANFLNITTARTLALRPSLALQRTNVKESAVQVLLMEVNQIRAARRAEDMAMGPANKSSANKGDGPSSSEAGATSPNGNGGTVGGDGRPQLDVRGDVSRPYTQLPLSPYAPLGAPKEVLSLLGAEAERRSRNAFAANAGGGTASSEGQRRTVDASEGGAMAAGKRLRRLIGSTTPAPFADSSSSPYSSASASVRGGGGSMLSAGAAASAAALRRRKENANQPTTFGGRYLAGSLLGGLRPLGATTEGGAGPALPPTEENLRLTKVADDLFGYESN